MTNDFLKDVLAGRKSLLKKAAVSQVEVPHYDELAVKRLYPQFKDDKLMMQYFPDKYAAGKCAPRDYFFDVLNMIHPEYLMNVMAHADKQRFSVEGEAQKKQSIKINEYWAEQLASMPYLSCKSVIWMQFLLIFCVVQRKTVRPCTC